MQVTKFLNASAEFVGRLTIPPTFIGSMALVVRGITSNEPNDIDVIIARSDFIKLFGNDDVKVCRSGKLRSRYGKLEINGIQVEALAQVEILVNGEWIDLPMHNKKDYVRWNNRILPYINLDDLTVFYAAIGRAKDLDKIGKIANAPRDVGTIVQEIKKPSTRKKAGYAFRRLLTQCKVD